MNIIAAGPTDTLPTLLARAERALASAHDSAEVLEARDMARVAYDAAKSAGRMARAKQAHDDVISAVYRAQADALLIEARAKLRLADEYDAAQDRGEVAGPREGTMGVVSGNAQKATAADLGLRRDEIHEARKIRDAELASPGLAERALNAMVDRGDEPTRAALRRSVLAAVDDAKRGESRKNPNRTVCPVADRVSKFSGLCRSLADFSDDVERIAEWKEIPQMAERLPDHVRIALGILNRFMEAMDA